MDKIQKLLLAFFIAWISFVPEPIQAQDKFYLSLFLGIILFLSLAGQGFNFRQCFFNRQAAVFYAYLLLLLPSVFFSAQHKGSLNFYADFSLRAALVFFIFRQQARLKSLQRIFYFLAVCAGIVSLFGILEMLRKTNPLYANLPADPYYSRFIGKRMMSTLLHPNIVGAYLVTCLPLAGYFYRRAQNYRLRLFNLTLFSLIVAGVFLSFSRGTWIACLVMCTFWLWQKGRKKWLIALWLGFLLFCLVASFSLFGEDLAQRFGFPGLLNYARFSHRALNYQVSFKMFRAHPFVGVGLNQYRLLFTQYAPFELPDEVMVPDSIYLMHLAETGLFGFLGLVFLLGYALKKAWGNRQDAVFIGFIGLLINLASFDGLLWQTPFYLFWIFLG